MSFLVESRQPSIAVWLLYRLLIHCKRLCGAVVWMLDWSSPVSTPHWAMKPVGWHQTRQFLWPTSQVVTRKEYGKEEHAYSDLGKVGYKCSKQKVGICSSLDLRRRKEQWVRRCFCSNFWNVFKKQKSADLQIVLAQPPCLLRCSGHFFKLESCKLDKRLLQRPSGFWQADSRAHRISCWQHPLHDSLN